MGSASAALETQGVATQAAATQAAETQAAELRQAAGTGPYRASPTRWGAAGAYVPPAPEGAAPTTWGAAEGPPGEPPSVESPVVESSTGSQLLTGRPAFRIFD